MGDKKEEITPEEPAEPATPAKQPEPAKPKNKKAVKVVGLIIALVVIIAIVIILAMYGGDIFKSIAPSTTTQPTVTDSQMINVGSPGAASTVSKDDAVGTAIEGEFVDEDEVGYVYCEQLSAGDKVSTSGDPDKYDIEGPVWFVYVDEEPNAFFEHDTKFIFIDAATGEETVYEESWWPDINGEDLFVAAKDCGGLTELYAVQ